jgi:solute carrier family 25 protein 34/35
VPGGFAAVGAGFFTNALDVVKRRLQLQGALQELGRYKVHYRGFFNSFYLYVAAKTDGARALPKDLILSVCY